MEIRDNSTEYVLALPSLQKIVLDLKTISETIGSSYGKYFSYLILKLINCSIVSPEFASLKKEVPKIDFDEIRHFDSWADECVPSTTHFRIRREFVHSLQDLRRSADEMLKEDNLFDFERAALVAIPGLVGMYGRLNVQEIMFIFSLVAKSTKKKKR